MLLYERNFVADRNTVGVFDTDDMSLEVVNKADFYDYIYTTGRHVIRGDLTYVYHDKLLEYITFSVVDGKAKVAVTDSLSCNYVDGLFYLDISGIIRILNRLYFVPNIRRDNGYLLMDGNKLLLRFRNKLYRVSITKKGIRVPVLEKQGILLSDTDSIVDGILRSSNKEAFLPFVTKEVYKLVLLGI